MFRSPVSDTSERPLVTRVQGHMHARDVPVHPGFVGDAAPHATLRRAATPRARAEAGWRAEPLEQTRML
eukprot:355237-Chlamydomonas_euryale.AAC.7